MSNHPLYNQSGLQKNNESHVLYALANKQMELKRLEDEYQAKISKIKLDLRALETTICLFDNNGSETIKKLNIKSAKSVRKTRKSYFKSGEAMSLILKTLRVANKPLSFQEVLKLIWDVKSNEVSELEKENFSNSLSVSLNSIYKKGLLNKVMVKNKALWSIKD